jgi:predicted Fe-S protein YdhL (DUF1289 family)
MEKIKNTTAMDERKYCSGCGMYRSNTVRTSTANKNIFRNICTVCLARKSQTRFSSKAKR